MDLRERAAQIAADKNTLIGYWEVILPEITVPPHHQWMVWLVRFGFSIDTVRQGIDAILKLQSQREVSPEDAVKYASGTMHRIAKRAK